MMNTTNQNRNAATIAGLIHNFIVGGSTETEVAAMLDVDQSQVSRWRRGNTVPRRSNMAALAELLGIDPHDLELVRLESERVRAEVAARKNPTPAADFAKISAELKASKARILRLERDLAEALKTK
jgi:transcriptional regulator with XRE-family HTH domain